MSVSTKSVSEIIGKLECGKTDVYSSSWKRGLQLTVPQGSVLGARMYTMYTQMLANVIRKHHVQHHSYADDTQVYVRCEDNEDARSAAIVKLQTCISDICEWMRANALNLNETKTECIVFSRNKDPTSITVQWAHSQLQHTVKILGVTFDNYMTFENHASIICRSIHMNIRKIRRTRKYLTYEAVKTLVQCTVTVRLDYCNSLYCGLPLNNNNNNNNNNNSHLY